jgi:hypothetical protein
MIRTLTTLCIALLTTMCIAQTTITPPYFTGFEGVEGNLNYNYPTGWTSEDLNTNSDGNQSWQIIKNSESYTNAKTDSTAIHMLSNMTAANNDWLYTPGIEMVAGNTYNLSFWYNTVRFGETSEKLKIHVGNDTVSTAMSSEALWDNTLTNITYEEAVINYTPTTSGVFYFGFHYYSESFQYILLIDDVSITETITGILSQTVTDGAIIYPNPCNSDLHLSITNNDISETNIKVYNSTGMMVSNEFFNGNFYTLNTSELAEGIYTILVFGGEKQLISKKVIVQH